MKIHSKLEKNNNGTDYIIGDLHGCYDVLMDKLKEINFDEKVDRLFSVGDLVDRGPKNLECLRLIKEKWFFPVLGNHEIMMKNAIGGRFDALKLWMYNGGNWLNDLSDEEKSEFDILIDMVHDLPYAITVGDIGICHAQPPTDDWNDVVNENLSEYDLESMVWGRTFIKATQGTTTKNIRKTVHGHTPIQNPILVGNGFFIDTGAVYNGIIDRNGNPIEGKLTILKLEEL